MKDTRLNVKILRINMATQAIVEETVPESLMLLGGRAFTSHWVSSHVDPESGPLGRENQLVIAPGLLASTPVSSVHRLSVGAKSLLTGGLRKAIQAEMSPTKDKEFCNRDHQIKKERITRR